MLPGKTSFFARREYAPTRREGALERRKPAFVRILALTRGN